MSGTFVRGTVRRIGCNRALSISVFFDDCADVAGKHAFLGDSLCHDDSVMGGDHLVLPLLSQHKDGQKDSWVSVELSLDRLIVGKYADDRVRVKKEVTIHWRRSVRNLLRLRPSWP